MILLMSSYSHAFTYQGTLVAVRSPATIEVLVNGETMRFSPRLTLPSPSGRECEATRAMRSHELVSRLAKDSRQIEIEYVGTGDPAPANIYIDDVSLAKTLVSRRLGSESSVSEWCRL